LSAATTSADGALAGLLVALPLWTQFDRAAGDFQFAEFAPLIASFNVNYHLGIDGLSLLLILLNSFTTVLVVIAGWRNVACLGVVLFGEQYLKPLQTTLDQCASLA
jgi:NADH:ubiquinone oxidoreductase subunit 4 (subunit M)